MNKIEKIVSSVFMLIGIILIIVGVVIFNYTENFKENGIETVAEITGIHRYKQSANDYGKNTQVYVKYKVDGREYDQKLKYYVSDMQIGQEVRIYYNPNNPSSIQSAEGRSIVTLIPFGLGIIFFLIGIIILVIKGNKKKLKTRLVENGRKVYADIDEVTINWGYSVNRKHPYNIICKWQESSGNIYLFKSENVWFEPDSIIEARNIKQLPVYIDEDDFKKYYVEIDSIVENVEDLR